MNIKQNKNKTFSIEKGEEKEITLDSPGLYTVNLVGAGARVKIGGVFSLHYNQDEEVHVIIHHKAPHTRAETTLKGVIYDEARLKFVGRIIIDKDCGDSNSFLTERMLLLSDKAKAEAVPDLEILTDDVKCSHAASISRIPESQMFYLQSRGLSRGQAEGVIVEGFLGS